MYKASIAELQKIVYQSKNDIRQIADDNDRDIMLYLHWSAGHYGQYFDDYHINIDSDGSIYLSTDDLSEVKAHTWDRNSGAVGIALCCCAGADTNELGDEPPTEEQIDTIAKVIAILCSGFDIPCDYEHVMTHAEAADEDGYGLNDDDPDCRWDLSRISDDDDLGTGGDIIRAKANKYLGVEAE